MIDLNSEDIDQETGWSRSVVQLMARAICVASGVKPTSWALLWSGDGQVLHVGKRNVCVMTPDSIELFVNVIAVDRMRLEHLGITTKEMVNHWFPDDGKMRFPISVAPEVVELASENHLRAVGEVARIAVAKPKREHHAGRLRVKLNEIG